MITNQQRERVRELIQEGVAVNAIAKKLGISRPTIYKVLDENEDGEVQTSSYPPNESLNETTPGRGEIKGRGKRGETMPKAVSSPLVESLKAELEGAKVEFEIEKLEEAKGKWEERRDKERREKLEEERSQRLDETMLKMSEQQSQEKQMKIRNVIQKVKNEVLPSHMKSYIPIHVMSHIYGEIEKYLINTNVLSIPFDELVILAEGIMSRIVRELSNEIRPAMQSYLAEQCRELSNKVAREEYRKYCNMGGRLSFKNFVFSVIQRMSEEEQRSLLIDL
jgi:transposase-like protein